MIRSNRCPLASCAARYSPRDRGRGSVLSICIAAVLVSFILYIPPYTRLNSAVPRLESFKDSGWYHFTRLAFRALWSRYGLYIVTPLSWMLPASNRMPWAVILTALWFRLMLI